MDEMRVVWGFSYRLPDPLTGPLTCMHACMHACTQRELAHLDDDDQGAVATRRRDYEVVMEKLLAKGQRIADKLFNVRGLARIFRFSHDSKRCTVTERIRVRVGVGVGVSEGHIAKITSPRCKKM